MKKKSGVQIIAFLALFGIIIGIVGTGILIIFSGNNSNSRINNDSNITNEDLQKIINNSKSNKGSEKKEITLTGSKK